MDEPIGIGDRVTWVRMYDGKELIGTVLEVYPDKNLARVAVNNLRMWPNLDRLTRLAPAGVA